MKRLFAAALLAAAFFPPVQAGETSRLFSLYNDGKFKAACDEGVRHLGRHKQDEKYISLYAFACLRADKIDRLALPIIMLKRSKEARKNAAYFSVLLLQKNLLITSLENRTPLTGLSLPSTDHILSKVFDLVSEQYDRIPEKPLTVTDDRDRKKAYRIYLKNGSKGPFLVIEEYYDTILTKRHIYR